MKETAYHGTSSQHLDNIKEYGLDPKYSHIRDDHWLGQGVYFFDDYNKALWWADCVSKNSDYYKIVFETQIVAPDEEVLNLDNTHELENFMLFIRKLNNNIKQECSGKMPILNESTVRAFYFDYYKQTYDISVIIRTFSKTCAKYTRPLTRTELFKQRQIMRNLNLSFFEKQICVSKKECMQFVELVYKENEEVV